MNLILLYLSRVSIEVTLTLLYLSRVRSSAPVWFKIKSLQIYKLKNLSTCMVSLLHAGFWIHI
jgi:hypothetical protein